MNYHDHWLEIHFESFWSLVNTKYFSKSPLYQKSETHLQASWFMKHFAVYISFSDFQTCYFVWYNIRLTRKKLSKQNILMIIWKKLFLVLLNHFKVEDQLLFLMGKFFPIFNIRNELNARESSNYNWNNDLKSVQNFCLITHIWFWHSTFCDSVKNNPGKSFNPRSSPNQFQLYCLRNLNVS